MPDFDLKSHLDGLFADIEVELVLPAEEPQPPEIQELAAPEPAKPAPRRQRRPGKGLEKRALQLQTAAEVSRAATSILDLDELLPAVVELIRERYGLYYVGIFMLDGRGEWAALKAGTGQAGRAMIEQGHQLEVGGSSMIGWCVARRQARIALDVGEEAVRFANPLLPETRSEMALPLVSRDRVIGAMSIQSVEAAAFSEDDVAALQTMADQLANAIENARLFQESERRITELAMVNEVGAALAATQELEPLYEQVYRQVGRLFDTRNFYIATYREGDERWHSVFHVENGQRQPAAWHSLATGLTGRILQTGRPLLFRNRLEIVGFLADLGQPALGELAQSWMGVPLISADQRLGVMGIQNYSEPALYDDDDLILLATLGAQLAAALDRARQLEQTQTTLDETQRLYNASRRLSTAADLPAVAAALPEELPIAAINRALLWSLARDQSGELEAFVLAATWYGGAGNRPALQPGVRFPLGQFPAADYAVGKELFYCADVTQDERIDAISEAVLQRQHAVAVALLPLWAGERQLGALMLLGDTAHHFTESELRPYRALAGQMATLIDNQQLLQQTQAQLDDLTVIQQTMSKLSAAMTLTETVESLLPQLVAAVRADAASLYVLSGDQLQRIGAYPDGELGEVLPLSRFPLTQQVIESRQANVVAADDPRLQEQARERLSAAGVTATATIPLTGRQGVLGTLSISLKQAGRSFSGREVQLLQTLADQAAVALDNARLFEETQQSRQRFRDLYNQAPDGYFSIGADGLFTDVNETWLVWTGYSREELVNKMGPPHLMPPEHRPTFWDRIRYLQQRGRLTDWSVEWLRKDGSSFPTLVNATAVYDAFGNLVSSRVTVRDVTVFRRTETEREQLRADAEALYRAGQRITAARSVDEILATVLNFTQMYTVDRSLVALKDGENPDLPIRIAAAWDRRGSDVGLVGRRWSLDDVRPISALGPGERLAVFAGSKATLDERTRAALEQPGGGALAAVPLAFGDWVLGWLVISTLGWSRPFEERELDALQSIAGQAAVAIENRHLLEQATQRAEELGTLNTITTAVNQVLELQELLETALSMIMHLTGFEAGLISMIEPEHKLLALAAHNNLPAPMRRTLEANGLGGTLCDIVYQAGRTIALADMKSETPVDVRSLLKLGFQSYVGIPLQHRSETLGTICLFGYSAGLPVGLNIELLEAIGSQVGIGIVNARLFEQTQAALEEVEATHRRYLRGEWEGFLANPDRVWGYEDGPDGLQPAEQVWTPEIEAALAAGGLATQAGGDGAALAIPIQLRGQIIGVLDLSRAGESQVWTPEELELVRVISDQVAQALENARLLEQTERRAQRERLTAELASQIHGAGDLEGILETAATGLGRALGVSRALIRLQSPGAEERQELSNEAER